MLKARKKLKSDTHFDSFLYRLVCKNRSTLDAKRTELPNGRISDEVSFWMTDSIPTLSMWINLICCGFFFPFPKSGVLSWTNRNSGVCTRNWKLH